MSSGRFGGKDAIGAGAGADHDIASRRHGNGNGNGVGGSKANGFAGWADVALDKGHPAPLHRQLAEAIRDRVRSGTLPPGEQLPPERQLAEQAGISRMTARQALAALAREGVLEIRHGVGVFVAPPKLTYDALHLLGFTESTMRLGGAAATRVLAQVLESASERIAGQLDVPAGESVLRVVRLRSVADEPLLLETSWLPAASCPGLVREDLAHRSLYDMLEHRYGHRLAEARQTLEATTADDDEAALLGISPGSPVLLAEGVAITASGLPIEAFAAIYRGDRVRLGIASRREREGVGVGATERELSLVMA
jgi:GntR family transcriptional regulator